MPESELAASENAALLPASYVIAPLVDAKKDVARAGDQNHLLVEPVVMGIRGLAPDTLERHRYLLQCQRMCYNIK
ncbi:MAG: hypothetical protein SWK90_06455, partial [Chloroflexota bacterium]|nr:hypothetical protein [Chloroflexota bacterium]